MHSDRVNPFQVSYCRRDCQVWRANLSRTINHVYLKAYVTDVTEFPTRKCRTIETQFRLDAISSKFDESLRATRVLYVTA